MMRTIVLFACAAFLVVTPAPTSAQPSPVTAPTKVYPEATIHMSWLMLNYVQRCIRSSGTAMEAKYPGAKPMGVFLSQNMLGGNALSYFSVTFRKGAEVARFKRASDPSASVETVVGWTPEEIQAVAALSEAAILRSIEIRGRAFSPNRVAEAWTFTKDVAGDPLVPHEEAAMLTKKFLLLVKDTNVLNGLNKELKGEISAFKIKFRSGSPLKDKLNILTDPKAKLNAKQPAERDFNAEFRVPLRPSG